METLVPLYRTRQCHIPGEHNPVKQYGLHNFVCFLDYFSGDDTISTAPEEMGESVKKKKKNCEMIEKTNKMQQMLIFNNISTCFGHHYAHLQENKTYYCMWCAAL